MFVRCNTRNLIFLKNKKLKASRISITENLTMKRMKKLQTTREELCIMYYVLWIMHCDAVSDRVKLYYD